MNTKDPKHIALEFNECITRQDIVGLASLMTEDHTFIDWDGNVVCTKKVMIESWKKFFDVCPNYKNTFTRIEVKENLVIMFGYAYWSEAQPHDEAIWTATIINNLISEWRIYKNTPENRMKFNL